MNAQYARGEAGRAWVPNEAQNALAQAKLPYREKIVNGHALLTAKQAALLQSKKLLPPGQFTQEGVFVIAPGY